MTAEKVPIPGNVCQMIEEEEFRRVIGHFASGVAVVTTRRPDGLPCGLTVSAVSSVSLNPTLLLVCVDRNSRSHDCFLSSGFFAVNVMGEDGGEVLARRFAGRSEADKFAGVVWREAATGAPLLAGALAWMDCRVVESLPGGDHTIFLGEVLAADAVPGAPLVYFRGGFGRLVP